MDFVSLKTVIDESGVEGAGVIGAAIAVDGEDDAHAVGLGR